MYLLCRLVRASSVQMHRTGSTSRVTHVFSNCTVVPRNDSPIWYDMRLTNAKRIDFFIILSHKVAPPVKNTVFSRHFHRDWPNTKWYGHDFLLVMDFCTYLINDNTAITSLVTYTDNYVAGAWEVSGPYGISHISKSKLWHIQLRCCFGADKNCCEFRIRLQWMYVRVW